MSQPQQHKNQQAAKTAAPPPAAAPKAPAVPHADAPPAPPAPKHFRVLQSTEVPRNAAPFLLPKGKIISSQQYNIPELRRLGVPLEEVDGPNPSKPLVRILED